MNVTSEGRLSLVSPKLADLIRSLAIQLSQEAIFVEVVQGLRTWNQQDMLYAQGRTTPGKIVTNARGGYSYHNFGMAVDLAPENPDHTFDWNASHPQWKRMIALVESSGMYSGAEFRTFPDFPHAQLTGRFPVGAPDGEVRQIFKDGGMGSVWMEAFSPTSTEAQDIQG